MKFQLVVNVIRAILYLWLKKLKVLDMIHIFLLFNRQGKIRLQKWYDVYTAKDQRSIIRELITTVMKRTSNMSNILEWRNLQIVYKRYASLYLLLATSKTENELLTLELIHRYVEALDLYFGNVCELDIIYNFEKAHFILDEMIMGGEIMETSNRVIVQSVVNSDRHEEDEQNAISWKWESNWNAISSYQAIIVDLWMIVLIYIVPSMYWFQG